MRSNRDEPTSKRKMALLKSYDIEVELDRALRGAIRRFFGKKDCEDEEDEDDEPPLK